MWKIIDFQNWEKIYKQFGWIRDMENVPQDPIFHAEGDVLTHTKMVYEALLQLPEYASLETQEQHILSAAALLHDVEKRSTTAIEENGRITSRNHARKGEYTARKICFCDIPTPFKIRETVTKLVRYHGLPIWIFEKPNPLKSLLQCSLEVDTKLLYILAKADILGRICEDQQDLLERIEFFKEFCLEQRCFGQQRLFKSNLARFTYFQKEGNAPDYSPFDNTNAEVILMCGLPGTGKDTYIKKHFPDLPMISLDAIRRMHKISPKDKKAQGKVAQIAKEEARIFLRKKQPFVWNATNLTRKIRGQMIDLFSTYKARVQIIYLEVPYAQMMIQNKGREEIVPTNILEKMIGRLEVPAIWEGHLVEYVYS